MKKQIMIGSRIAFFLWISAAALAGPIHDAVRAGDLAKVKALVAANPKIVNEKDARGRTPLHFASGAGNVEIVKFLIAGGADVKAADPDGFTPLHWAAYEGRADAARALIAAGADSNARGGPGVDTLESAFYGRHPEAVEALLQGGLRVESKGDEGRALLHRAASAGFLSLVDYILSHGGSAEGKSDTGGTLLHAAPRATKTLKGMEIFTVNCEQDDVPEVAYLVKVDGLSIYHSGDYLGPVDGFKADMDYLLNKAGVVDLAFIGKFQQAELLKPKVVFPIHAGGREYMYGAFARKAASKKLPSRVICPENNGDRFMIER